jgi:hypothetical protein
MALRMTDCHCHEYFFKKDEQIVAYVFRLLDNCSYLLPSTSSNEDGVSRPIVPCAFKLIDHFVGELGARESPDLFHAVTASIFSLFGIKHDSIR